MRFLPKLLNLLEPLAPGQVEGIFAFEKLGLPVVDDGIWTAFLVLSEAMVLKNLDYKYSGRAIIYRLEHNAVLIDVLIGSGNRRG